MAPIAGRPVPNYLANGRIRERVSKREQSERQRNPIRHAIRIDSADDKRLEPVDAVDASGHGAFHGGVERALCRHRVAAHANEHAASERLD